MVAFLIIAAIIIISIIIGINKVKVLRQFNERSQHILSNIPNFQPADMFFSEISLAYDKERQKLCFLTLTREAIVYDFQEILQSELVVDDLIIQSQSSSSTFGRSVVGGLVAGGVGAIIGGSSAKKIQRSDVKSIVLKITTDDSKHPVWKISYLKTLTKRVSIIFTNAYNQAERWQGVLTAIIKQGEKASVQSQPTSASDEITKLKALFDNGTINETEFTMAKQKLLS